MTDDDAEHIQRRMAAQGYEPNGSGGWIKKVRNAIPLCCICFSRVPVRGKKRCDDCGTESDE